MLLHLGVFSHEPESTPVSVNVRQIETLGLIKQRAPAYSVS